MCTEGSEKRPVNFFLMYSWLGGEGKGGYVVLIWILQQHLIHVSQEYYTPAFSQGARAVSGKGYVPVSSIVEKVSKTIG